MVTPTHFQESWFVRTCTYYIWRCCNTSNYFSDLFDLKCFLTISLELIHVQNFTPTLMAHLLRGSWFVQIWINTTWECFNTSNSFQSILILRRILLLIPIIKKWAPLPNLAYPTPGIMIWTKLCQLYPRKLPHKIQLFCLNGFWEEFTWENVNSFNYCKLSPF